MTFDLVATCLHCGGELACEGTPRVTDIEATARVLCLECKAEGTIKVLYTNRTGPSVLPQLTLGSSFAGAR